MLFLTRVGRQVVPGFVTVLARLEVSRCRLQNARLAFQIVAVRRQLGISCRCEEICNLQRLSLVPTS